MVTSEDKKTERVICRWRWPDVPESDTWMDVPGSTESREPSLPKRRDDGRLTDQCDCLSERAKHQVTHMAIEIARLKE